MRGNTKNRKKTGSIITLLTVAILLISASTAAYAVSQIDIVAPAGSGGFGEQLFTLPNGNIVVIDSRFDLPGPIVDAGAVYLYNGTTGALISTITGSSLNDFIGRDGVTILPSGNFLVRSKNWDNGAAIDAGAVTWCSGTTGCSGVISSANSLVGSTSNDNIGALFMPYVLANGNYLVLSPTWDDGAVVDAGAVTFGDGATGISGPISDANSLVGSVNSDGVGNGFIYPLTNGNYVVSSPVWDNGAVSNAGAVTFGNGTTGISGAVSTSNSLVGSSTDDNVGYPSVVALTNGNYVVRSPNWRNGTIAGAGAATWADGTTGLVGTVSPANSLVGSKLADNVSGGGVTALSNGNYVVASPTWDNGAVFNSGAATWGDGTAGISGTISAANSLTGATVDTISSGGIIALTNGNYAVSTPGWRNGTVSAAGAVTWGDGSAGTVGMVSTSNSLVGSTLSDGVGGGSGGGVTALTNGNYVVRSSVWNNGPIVDAGAVTWCDGTTATASAVSPANSLVGSTANDRIATFPIQPLTVGNYVLVSPNWDNGPIVDAGAATWGNGLGGSVGPLSAANSIVGSTASDGVGNSGITTLTNGSYVVSSTNWDNGGSVNAGAATFGNGSTGVVGVVSAANSLVGSAANDNVSNDGITRLTNGNYVVRSTNWDNGPIINVGASTWGDGTTGISGTVSAANSLIGSTANDRVGGFAQNMVSPNGNYVVYSSGWDNGPIVNAAAISYGAGNGGTVGTITAGNSVFGSVSGAGSFALSFAFDAFNETLVVRIPLSNKVSIFNPTYKSVSDGDWSANLTWDYGSFNKLHDVYIPNGRTVNLDVVDIVSSLRIDCTGGVTGANPAGYIIGDIRKDFCSTGAFSYPSGTDNRFSPVHANVTALAADPSSLTVSATETVHPTLSPVNSLKRFWTLTENGDLTTDLIFNYVDPTDISSAEATYDLYRVEGGVPTPVPFFLNTAANMVLTTNVSSFSDWAVGNLTPPETTTAVEPAAGQYSDAVTLRATLGTDSGSPEGTMEFRVDSVLVGTVPVNGTGSYSSPYVITNAPGDHTIKASFISSNANFGDSSGTNTLTVTKEDAKVEFPATNPSSVKVNSPGGTAGPVTICADITEIPDGSPGNITNATATFTITQVAGENAPSPGEVSYSGGGVGGTRRACITLTDVAVDIYDITVTVGGYYQGTNSTVLAIYDPSLGFVTGSGKITHNGVQASFTIVAKYHNNGTVKGSLVYTEPRPGGTVTVESTSIESLSIVNGTAVIIARATVNGVVNHGIRVIAVDKGEPGSNDQLGLTTTAPGGGNVPDLTFGLTTLKGGNIQVH